MNAYFQPSSPFAAGLLLWALFFAPACDHHTADDGHTPDVGYSDAHQETFDDMVDATATSWIQEEELREFIERWGDAQTRSDFDDFSKLYSSEFRGHREADDGSSMTTFDRNSWLKAERDAFDLASTIDVEDLHIEIDSHSHRANLAMVDTVATASKAHQGPREIVATVEEGDLRIIEEYYFERSEVARDTDVKAPPAEQLASVVTEGYGDNQASYLVIEDETDPQWFREHIDYIGYEAARAPIDTDALPEQYFSWKDEPLKVFDASGTACKAEVVELHGLSRAVPHFGQIYQWKGDPHIYGDELESSEAADKEVIADGVWQLGHAPYLVAEIEWADDDACNAHLPIWGRLAEKDQAQPLTPVELEDEVEQELIETFRDLEAYEAIQENYLEWFGDDGPADSEDTWSTYRGASPEVAAYRSEETQRTFAMVWGDAGVGCGDFWAASSKLFEIRVEKKGLRLVKWGDLPRSLRPTAMIDTEGDGAPHILTESLELPGDEFLLAPHHGAHRIVQSLTVLFYDCRC